MPPRDKTGKFVSTTPSKSAGMQAPKLETKPRKTTTKGHKRVKAPTGARLAYDDTKDATEKTASKATLARKTTTKGAARKTAPVGSRKAYDDTKQEATKKRDALARWRAAVKAANKKHGTTGVPRKGSASYKTARALYDK